MGVSGVREGREGKGREGRDRRKEGKGGRVWLYLGVFAFPLGRHDTSGALVVLLAVMLSWARRSALCRVVGRVSCSPSLSTQLPKLSFITLVSSCKARR